MGHEELATILTEREANIEASRPLNIVATRLPLSLQTAASGGKIERVSALLSRGTHVNIGGNFGTSLQAGAASSDSEVVSILLDAGANLHARGGCCGNIFRQQYLELVQTATPRNLFKPIFRR